MNYVQPSFNWLLSGKHKNILPIIECENFGNQIAIVSEFAPNGSLQDLLNKQGSLSVADAVEITIGILDGLAHLHTRKIIHRDLKPDNILFQGKIPRLTDFGISRAMPVDSNSKTASGTFGYMAPEAFDGKRNSQTDVWSVGVILYQLLTGIRPFPQKEQTALIGAIVMREPEPLPNFVPLALQNIVSRALAKNSTTRYQTASEMRQDLENILNDFFQSETITIHDLSKTEIITDAKPANHLTATKPLYTKDSVATQISEKESVVTQLPTMKAGAVQRNSIGMEFVYIPPGDFMMGSTNGQDNEKPIHKVTISNGFWMGKTEVTQAQWQAVMGSNPSYFKDCPQCPVEQVSWDNAQSFVSKLNAQNDGYKYRLPTEAEWEYAARAGTTGDYAGNLDSMAWYYANSEVKTHPVGTKQANAWGLYDMHGNVLEWCQDWSGDYPSGAITDPTGATSGLFRVIRGGNWGNTADDLRSAFREGSMPSGRGYILGFRLLRQ